MGNPKYFVVALAMVCWMSSVSMCGVLCADPSSDTAKTTEKNGLSVIAKPTKKSFSPGESLAFTLTYRNTSKEAFRLPEQPGAFNYWELKLDGNGKSYTGRTMLPLGDVSPANPSNPILPGKELSADVHLQSYAYCKGEWNRAKAKRWLPSGKYKAIFNLRFPNRPPQDDKTASVWKGDMVLSSPVEIEIGK